MMHVGLRYFTAVARHGSIREAAEELHVAQSALSRQIQKMEKELGAPLFQRHARGVELQALKGLRRGTGNVHSIESLVPHLLPRVVARFSMRYPGINFEIIIDGSDRVVAAVREGRTDIGLAFYPPAEPDL